MKKIYCILSFTIGLLVLLTACGENTEFTLQGNLGTPKDEFILLVHDDPIAKVDTIFPEKGKFEYIFTPDTITLMRMIDQAGHVIPIFADKGWSVTCKGNFMQPSITGEGPNNDYQEFLKSIENMQTGDSLTFKKAEEFIRSHPQSFASAYLINRYFIQTVHPDIDKINSLISPLAGEIKDSRILNVAMKSFPTKEDKQKTHLGYYSVKSRNGEYVSWHIEGTKYILINFWASWDKKSRAERDSLIEMQKRLPKGVIRIFNISLDSNRKEWLAACKPDTENWAEICDLKGWETALVKENNIVSLPSNILITPQRKLITTNIDREALVKKVEE